MYKIAVFSDIHGNLESLKAIINDIKKRRIDEIIALGDIVGIGPDSNECITLIREMNIVYLLGNHEEYISFNVDNYNITDEDGLENIKWTKSQISLRNKNYLERLKYSIDRIIEGKSIYLSHYARNESEFFSMVRNDDVSLIREIFPKRDIVVYGHKHSGTILKNCKTIYINLDSSGCTNNKFTSYNILSFDNEIFNNEKIIVEYNREDFEERMNSIDYPNKKVVSKIFFGM